MTASLLAKIAQIQPGNAQEREGLDEFITDQISRMSAGEIEELERDGVTLFPERPHPRDGRICECEDAPCCGCYSFGYVKSHPSHTESDR